MNYFRVVAKVKGSYEIVSARIDLLLRHKP